jgi:EmrB/QacA subfamily drug resistance transporter
MGGLSASEAASPASEPGIRYASAQGRYVLLATVLGSGLALLDGTIVNVALPRIGETFGASLTSLQWTVNAYAFTLAALLLLAGSLGDRFGRRRVFLWGVVWFALASAGCAVAPTVGILIAMRALQGVGGALLTPGSLAILEAVFVREDRSTAVGAWSGFGAIAGAVGPVLGGLLVQLGSWTWRLAFLINVPLAAVVVALSLRHVPETRDEEAADSIDVSGTTLAALGLGGVVYGLTEGPVQGWDLWTTGALSAGVLALGAFVAVEARRTAPLVPLGIFRSMQFSAANAVTLLVYAALGGAFFLLPLQLQEVMGLSPLVSGSSLLPITAVMVLLSARMGRLAEERGPRLPMTFGPLLAAAGLALMARIGAGSSYFGTVIPAVVVFALGLTATVAPLTATVLAAAPRHQIGLASAINNDVARTGSLLAVAVLPALAGLTAAHGGVRAALVAGYPRGMLIAALFCALGGVLAGVTIRKPKDEPDEPRPFVDAHSRSA